MNRSRVATWCLSLGVLTSLLNAQPVSFASGAEAVASSAVAPESARITGRVTDREGHGIPNVAVLAAAQGWFGGNEAAITNGTGHFSLAVAPGIYRMRFTPDLDHVVEYWPNANGWDSATDVAIGANQTISRINASLAEAGHIVGTFSTDDGGEDTEVPVLAYRQQGDGWILQSGATHTWQGFRIDRLPAGTYKLEVFDSRELRQAHYSQKYWPNAASLEEATSFSVVAGSTVRKDVSLVRTGRISGLVRGEELAPLDGTTVTAFERVGDKWVEVAGADTSNGGKYELVGLDPGGYRLRFFHRVTGQEDLAESYSGGGADVASAADVHVTSGAITSGMNAVLSPGATISGRVTFSATPSLDRGGILVYRRASNGQWMQIPDVVGVAEDGRYDYVGLNPGTYRVEYVDGRGNYVSEFVGGSEVLAGGADVVVPPGGAEVTGIDLDVQRAGRIKGRVIDPLVEYEAWDQAMVTIYRWVNGDWASAASVKLGSTSDGKFDFGGVAPGRYRIGVSDRAAGNFWADEYWPEAPTLQQAQDIEVASGETETGKDVTLSPGIRTIVSPTVRGRAQVGGRLTVDAGHWSPLGTRLVYQWFSDSDPISGAVSPTYSPTTRDLGERISVRVAGQRTHWVGVPVRTSATAPVGRGSIVARERPQVTGKPIVGRMLRVVAGRWAPADVRVSYAWFADGELAGKGPRLVLTRRHLGSRLTVKVTATSAGYRPKVLTLRSTGVVRS
jgi:hypothetical protein